MSKIVIALGGNALGKTPQEQHDLLIDTCKNIVDLVEAGNQVVITHGNGPQVGMIYNAMQDDDMPFAESGAMSQGYIGYQLQQQLKDELDKRKIKKDVVTVVTQVEVDPKDEAFKNPTKPIGDFMTEEEAKKAKKEDGGVYKEDSGRGWRKVVASPTPKKILELSTIRNLLDDGTIVIACGGGGVPVVMTKNDGFEGIDAVIDKDRTSALLAKELNADQLVILTAVDKVCLNYHRADEEPIDRMSVGEARVGIRNDQFGEGSMLPKVESAIDFVKATGKEAIITSLDKAKEALEGKNGTVIYKPEIKKEEKKKHGFSLSLSSFTIILILIYILAVVTHFLPTAKTIVVDEVEEIVAGSGVIGASLSQTLLSPVKGFVDAIDICVFVLILGAFLKVVNETQSIETGIQALVKKLKGRELVLIPILMFIFSICGSTYGMLEETVGFYAILAATMVAAGMDTIVSSAIVLLGAGSGTLGSTVNPFAVGVAIDALPEGIKVNQGIVIGLGIALWLSTLLISIFFVMRYAKKVIAKKGSTFLSLQEQKDMEEYYGDTDLDKKDVKLTGKQVVTLILFAFTFLVMIVGFIPWEDFGVNFFVDTPFIGLGWLVGAPIGEWYFQESTLWFLIMTIVIAICNRMKESKIVDLIIDGADDMVGVILIIALARGASVLMSETGLDSFIITKAADVLRVIPKGIFAPANYFLHVGLSFLVPSSSGLATLSTPIMGALANSVGYNVETTVMEMVAANGFVNLFTPTCGAIMGGLALAKVEYTTWLKWVGKVLFCIALANLIILTAAMLIL